MAKILVVYHSQSGNTQQAAEIVAGGIRSIEGTEAVIKPALEAGADDLVECDGIVVGTPDYFSYMAGGLKDFFDRTFYPTQGKVTDKPCGIFITHGGGGRPAAQSVESICRSFKFKKIDEPVLVMGKPDNAKRNDLISLGEAVATECAGS